MRTHDDYTRPEERIEVHRFFRDHPDLELLFERAWIDPLMHPLAPRDAQPPIFWTLANPLTHATLAESLRLVAGQRAVTPVVRDLKLPDEDSVVSLLRELAVFCPLRQGNDTVRWKPPVQGAGGRSPDLSLMLNGRELLLEILTVRDSGADQEQNRALDQVVRFINQMKNHRYLVSYKVEAPFSAEYLGACRIFLRRTIQGLVAQGAREAEAQFPVGSRTVLAFEFKASEHLKGQWVSTMHGARQIRDAGRIKGKIFDKLDEFQFPRGTDHVKGYVMILEGLFADQEAVVSAIQGRSAVAWRGTPGNYTTELVRQPDGAVADATRGKLLLEEVDFVVSLKPNGGMALEQIGAIVNGERGRMSIEEVRNLFSWA